MPTKYSDTKAPLRQALADSFTELLRSIEISHPGLGVYLIGSFTHPGTWGAKDVDLLLVDLATIESRHTRELQRLKKAIKDGRPFEGAFDCASKEIHELLDGLIEQLRTTAGPISVTASFAFGPAKGEVSVPDEALHIHICGPLTLGDFPILKEYLPFHTAEFFYHHLVINGPDLRHLIGDLRLRPQDLIEWDASNLSRIDATTNEQVKRKWFRRLVRDRYFIDGYREQYRALLDRAERTAIDGDSKQMGADLLELIASAQAFAEQLPQDPEGV